MVIYSGEEKKISVEWVHEIEKNIKDGRLNLNLIWPSTSYVTSRWASLIVNGPASVGRGVSRNGRTFPTGSSSQGD